MGICLDTDKKNNEDEIETSDSNSIWFTNGKKKFLGSVDQQFIMQSEAHVRFETPKIPVIFVLGGPGSGKVSHCDTIADEKRGIIHINMTDLMQQFTIGSGESRDYNQLSSIIVAEVLMLEMKMSPAATTFLISGYPRNMRDVVEYGDKIKTVTGVIVLTWEQENLRRQIEYGAKLGHIILSLAKMELNNFYINVMPVIDFYDQRKMLISIKGERTPPEVYSDFRAAVLRIISSKGNSDIINVRPINDKTSHSNFAVSHQESPKIPSIPTIATTAVSVHNPPASGYPNVIFVIGGPGTNKAISIEKVLERVSGWVHISIGELLRLKIDSMKLKEEAQKLKETILNGEIIDKVTIFEILDQSMLENINANGIVINGFPRDIEQLQYFENKYQQRPLTILLDCSIIRFSRAGRWDDNVTTFRKRTEVFRKKTVPLLKLLDEENRLTVIDGDTSIPENQRAFLIALYSAIQQTSENPSQNARLRFEALQQNNEGGETALQVLKPQMNGYGPPKERHPIRGNNVVSVSHAKELTTGREINLPRENPSKINAQAKLP